MPKYTIEVTRWKDGERSFSNRIDFQMECSVDAPTLQEALERAKQELKA